MIFLAHCHKGILCTYCLLYSMRFIQFFTNGARKWISSCYLYDLLLLIQVLQPSKISTVLFIFANGLYGHYKRCFCVGNKMLLLINIMLIITLCIYVSYFCWELQHFPVIGVRELQLPLSATHLLNDISFRVRHHIIYPQHTLRTLQ